ncbi:MAG: hypothetical protein ACOY3Z_00065 [Thermodesulfobacteriota bacterium]
MEAYGFGMDRRNGIQPPPDLEECIRLLGLRTQDLASLPFAGEDATAGVENELQVAVAGGRRDVDLPCSIEESSYFANLIRHARSGETSFHPCRELERYLADNPGNVWENSWVRFRFARLGATAREVLAADLRADKRNPVSPERADRGRFFFHRDGEKWLRLPVSYLLKLALADLLDGEAGFCPATRATGRRLLDHFLSDNTSPETFSFHVVHSRTGERLGRAVARETAKRFLLSHLLLDYANKKFGLAENGQRAMIFFSPHPPVRQRQLNNAISDAFYRELFMSPCLSGWADGEAKHRYMGLCHQVLSRSHINAVMKLREAGIITNNLVVLPHTSNISLANNGTHVSMGSVRLARLQATPASGFVASHEKCLGDLVAKIVEHFLPLFVGTYSGAPYRLAYEDFHPEKVLAFLPHQLDYSHLRMVWRRWRKKAKNRLLGQPMTPFGPPHFDRILGRLFGLRGDFLPDFRLLDYPVALLATERNSAQDGRLDNDLRLKADLDALGVFDRNMSLYQLYKLRQHAVMGFSGFEARYYSQFESLGQDMAPAVELQRLLNCLAFKYIADKTCSHASIPATPFVESERRQIFFGAAIGLPTFFVRRDTPNAFLSRILKRVEGIRPSHRYPGYLRVHNHAYRLALVRTIREDGAELVEMFGLAEILADLERRLVEPETASASGRLVRGILERAGEGERNSPMRIAADEFNQAAEAYYRDDLRVACLVEGWEFLGQDVREMERGTAPLAMETRGSLQRTVGDAGAAAFLAGAWRDLNHGNLASQDAARLIRLLLLAEECDARRERLGHREG